MSEKDKNYSLSGFQYGVAGATTGTVTRFLVQPLDVLKITFQLQVTPLNKQGNAKYNSVYQAIKTIAKEEGIFGLWKGHIPAQYLSIVFGAVQFSSYEALIGYLTKNSPYNYTTYEHIVSIGCGSVAGLAATVTSFPFDVVKTHLVFQSEPKIYKGTLDALIKIYKREGANGFNKGLAAACIQTAPLSGLVFCFHGIFSQLWFLMFQVTDHSFIMSTTESMTTGLLAGLCAKTIVYPLDLTKKRLQIQNFDSKLFEERKMIKCKTITECFTLTIKHEGYRGLFKGFVPTIIKTGATTSLYFTIYDKICELLHYSFPNR